MDLAGLLLFSSALFLAAASPGPGIAAIVARVLGPRLTADTGEWGTFAWAKFLCGTPGMRIAGGTDEVLRNIIGERVLGLPKEPGIDSVSPFKDLLKN